MFPHAGSMGISHSGDQTATRRLRGMDDGRHAGIPAVPDVIGIGTSVATDAGTGVSPPPAPPPGDFSRPVPSHGESHTEKHADVADSTTPAVEPISRLMGVRPDDGMRGQSAKRDVPRLRFRPFHAVTVMLVLTTALCASLTMLLQQSLRYVSAQSHNAAMQNAGGKETGIAETLPGGSDGSDSVNGDGSNSGGTGSDQENSGGAGDAESQGDGVESSAGSQAAQNGRSSQQGSDGSDDGATADTRIDLNTATAEQLDSIPGVGPVTAQRILDHRRSIGRFTSVDQLLDVSGIGAKTLTKIRPWVRV